MESVAGPSLSVIHLERDIRAITSRIAFVAAGGLALLAVTAPFAHATALVPFSLDLAARIVVCLSGVALAGHPVFETRAGHVSVLLRVFSLGMCAAYLVYWVLPLDWLEEELAGHSAIRLTTASAMCDAVFLFALFRALHVLTESPAARAAAHAGAALAGCALLASVASVALRDVSTAFGPAAALVSLAAAAMAIALLVVLAWNPRGPAAALR